MKQVLENTVYVNENGEIVSQSAKMVNYGRRMGYTKLHRPCFADVPLWFFMCIVDCAKIDSATGCLGAELSPLYDTFKNKKTFRKYITALEKENLLIRVGMHYYLINPSYLHHGTQTSTEHAIVEYGILAEFVTENGSEKAREKYQAAENRRIKRMQSYLGSEASNGLLTSEAKKHLKDIPSL